MNESKILHLLGLANRAGCVAAGGMAVERAIFSGQCQLLIVATDTATDTYKRIEALQIQTHVPMLRILTKQQIGAATGKSPKAAIAITDQGFTRSLRRLIVNEA